MIHSASRQPTVRMNGLTDNLHDNSDHYGPELWVGRVDQLMQELIPLKNQQKTI